MRIISKMRKQKATYWRRLQPDQYGRFAYDAPVEVHCRWDDVGEEYRTASEEMQVSRAVVYPDRVMELGDKLKKGDMESDIPEDPSSLNDAFEIQRFDQTPTLKATAFLFTAYL